MELIKIILNFVSSLIWPGIALFVIVKFQEPIAALFRRLQSAKLPAGMSFEFGEALKEATEIAHDLTANPDEKDNSYAKIPPTDANRLLIERGLRPSPSGLDLNIYKNMVSQDPTLALAGLRSEVDAIVRNLADGFGVQINARDSAIGILAKLHTSESIYTRQYKLGRKVIELCNAAIQGTSVTRTEAESIIDAAGVLTSEYVDWLGWGFNNKS